MKSGDQVPRPASRAGATGGRPGWLDDYRPGDGASRPTVVYPGSATDVAERLNSLTESCGEVHAIVPASRLDEPAEMALLPLPDMFGSGARMRVLFVNDILDHAPSMRVARASADAGVEIRTIAEFPTWLTIMGRELVMVPREPAKPHMGILLIHGGGVAVALWLFERLWRSGRPLAARYDRRPHLTPWEYRVLSHLASGAKDETSARALGVSPRTYRRHVTRLCETLGASSRFEAGMLAAQVGLT